MKKTLVVLSGAGISAESGIKTFRDSDGLWENYNVNDVADPEGWCRNPRLVLDFYNQRRTELQKAQPNPAHKILADLESRFNVEIVTQNIDNLHERAGSTRVLHLHGELTKVQSDKNPVLIKDIGYRPVELGELAPDGGQWRPHVVWFGEPVPNIEKAVDLVRIADILLIVGTSLNVYPAAGLLYYASDDVPLYLIDPKPASVYHKNLHIIRDRASTGMQQFRDTVLKLQ